MQAVRRTIVGLVIGGTNLRLPNFLMIGLYMLPRCSDVHSNRSKTRYSDCVSVT